MSKAMDRAAYLPHANFFSNLSFKQIMAVHFVYGVHQIMEERQHRLSVQNLRHRAVVVTAVKTCVL